jgi:ATP-dependent Clp protease ATP-binding subunit ClpA
MLPPTLLDPNRARKHAKDLQSKLCSLIIGQNEVIGEIVDTYRMYLTGLAAPGRPTGNFAFLGTTGSGKTGMVELPRKC